MYYVYIYILVISFFFLRRAVRNSHPHRVHRTYKCSPSQDFQSHNKLRAHTHSSFQSSFHTRTVWELKIVANSTKKLIPSPRYAFHVVV